MGYFNGGDYEVTPGDDILASDLNDALDGLDTAFALLDTDVPQAKEWAVGPGDPADMDTEVETGLYSSRKYADNAENSADAASDSETASAASEAAALATSGATVYSGSATYNSPDAVIGTDGHTYRCIGTLVSGDDPVSSSTGDWVRLTGVTSTPNLLINTGFVVNQKDYDADGFQTITAGSYGHDMWQAYGGGVTYTKNAASITLNTFYATAAGYVHLRQKNDDIIAADGEEVTLSFYVASLTNPFLIAASGLSAQTISTTGWHSITFTATSDGTVMFSHQFAGSGSYTVDAEISQIKYERGSSRTTWYPPEPRAEELRCYYYYLILQVTNNWILGSGYTSSTQAVISVPIVITMKDTVTCTAYDIGDFNLMDRAGDTHSLSSVTSVEILPSIANVILVVATTTATGPCALIGPTGVGSPALEFDARY